MNSYSLALFTSLILGSGLGLLYFGGLWITILRFNRTTQPILLMWSSFILRLGAVLGVFHLILQKGVSDHLLGPLLLTFLGFLWARNVLISSIIPQPQKIKKRRREVVNCDL
ncbi:ATP synthase subunit I (plasmid) [Acaryochloris sp. 'Moss Beach']|uniref:ATP synthase subunit I n=1 Tax=Acaryochloris TaxID=155977 RepID=UPI001BAFD885|nr:MULTISPECIES: ATP synthase subunit I [Acaryochloris]QUY46085.1 ATP synthase subunit I [Acaryochloris marina S15]UJB72585.1 ATP synthase subunit I [Acaryochloris sp. 'Moss Beach']